MSNAYYVSAHDQNVAMCAPTQLAAWISAEWPMARHDDAVTGETYASEWTLPEFAAKISRDGNTVVMRGNVLEIAKFVAWLRQHVSDSVELIFFDESGVWNVLTRELSAAQIARAFGYVGSE